MNAGDTMKKEYLPLIGVLASLAIFALSATRYPGGYDWIHHSISALFQPTALNGEENPARKPAMLAVFIFCVSVGILFKSVSMKGKSHFHRKTIEIAGIGSMVYAFLVVTPMHNVLVSVSLLFYVTAMLAILHLLYVERHVRMFCAGMVCVALLLTGAVMYYGNVLFGLLPLVQKTSLAMSVSWLFALQFSESKGGAQRSDPA